MRDLPFLISKLVAAAITASWTNEVLELLGRCPSCFTDEDLATFASLARSERDIADFRFDYERMMVYDFVQRTYTDDGKGDGRFTMVGLAMLSEYGGWTDDFLRLQRRTASSVLMAPAAAAWHPSRREYLAMADKLYDAAECEQRKPLWERDTGHLSEFVSIYDSHSIHAKRHFMMYMIAPIIEQAIASGALAAQRLDAIGVAVAIECFRRVNGRWPDTLGELTPGYLDSVPVDQFDGAPLRYRLVEGEPVLYSIGMDRTDHGGVPHITYRGEIHPDAAGRWEPSRRVRAAVDHTRVPQLPGYSHKADWVLFSPSIARQMDEFRRRPRDPSPDEWPDQQMNSGPTEGDDERGEGYDEGRSR